MMVLITYDICDKNAGEKRLRKVSKICENYGQRVQYSVFECLVDPAQWEQLKYELIKTVDLKKDSLRFYFLGSNWIKRIEHVGVKNSYNPEGALII